MTRTPSTRPIFGAIGALSCAYPDCDGTRVSFRGVLEMTKLVIGFAAFALVAAGFAVAQDNRLQESEAVFDTSTAPTKGQTTTILIEDPAPETPEYSKAEGAADAEIISSEELAAEAEAEAALGGDMEGDMAAMHEAAEDPEW